MPAWMEKLTVSAHVHWPAKHFHHFLSLFQISSICRFLIFFLKYAKRFSTCQDQNSSNSTQEPQLHLLQSCPLAWYSIHHSNIHTLPYWYMCLLLVLFTKWIEVTYQGYLNCTSKTHKLHNLRQAQQTYVNTCKFLSKLYIINMISILSHIYTL